MKFALFVSVLFATGCMRNVDVPAARTLSGQEVREGCLSRTAEGEFVLAEGKTGERIAVTGNPLLAQHSGNHTVRIIGMAGTESGGSGLRAIQVEHIAASCKAPFPK